jgi:hypothetical protein
MSIVRAKISKDGKRISSLSSTSVKVSKSEKSDSPTIRHSLFRLQPKLVGNKEKLEQYILSLISDYGSQGSEYKAKVVEGLKTTGVVRGDISVTGKKLYIYDGSQWKRISDNFIPNEFFFPAYGPGTWLGILEEKGLSTPSFYISNEIPISLDSYSSQIVQNTQEFPIIYNGRYSYFSYIIVKQKDPITEEIVEKAFNLYLDPESGANSDYPFDQYLMDIYGGSEQFVSNFPERGKAISKNTIVISIP